MSRKSFITLRVILSAAFLTLTWIKPVIAGGLLIPASSVGVDATLPAPCFPMLRTALMRTGEAEQVLITEPVYHGPRIPFCWILAVPGELKPEDIFFASPDFLDAVYERVKPVCTLETREPIEPLSLSETADFPWPYVIGQLPVLRMEGEPELIDANLEHLCAWLDDNGFKPEEKLRQKLEQIAQGDVSFLCLKLRPPAGNEIKPGEKVKDQCLATAPPLAIRSKNSRFMLPLEFFAMQARARTVIDAVVITSAPTHAAGELSTDITGITRLSQGKTYEQFLNELAPGKWVREAVVKGALNYSDLAPGLVGWSDYEAKDWVNFWSSSFHGIFTPEQLKDTVFEWEPKDAYRTHIAYSWQPHLTGLAAIRTPGRQAIILTLALVCLAGILWLAGLTTDQSPNNPGSGHLLTRFMGRLFVFIPALLFTYPLLLAVVGRLGLIREYRMLLGGQYSLGMTVSLSLLLVMWAIIALEYVIRSSNNYTRGRLAVFIIATVLFAGMVRTTVIAPEQRLQVAIEQGYAFNTAVIQLAMVLTSAGFSALIGLLIVAPFTRQPRPLRLAREYAALLAVTLLLWPLLYEFPGEKAKAGFLQGNTNAEMLVARTQQIELALYQMLTRYACFPANLSDLTSAEAPTEGLDPAGNAVPLTADKWQPALTALPPGMAGDAKAGWLMAINDPNPVMYAGLVADISTPTQEAGSDVKPQKFWTLQKPAALRQSLGVMEPLLLNTPDSLVRFTEVLPDKIKSEYGCSLLGIDLTNLKAVSMSYNSPVLVSSGAEGSSLLFANTVRQGYKFAETGPAAGERSAIFELSSGGHALTPASYPIRGRITHLEGSPDGLWIACGLWRVGYAEPELWLVAPGGQWVGPLVTGLVKVRWHPSGRYLVVLAGESGDAEDTSCRLLKIGTDGLRQRFAPEQIFRSSVLCVSDTEIFCVDSAGKLRAVELSGKSVRLIKTKSGEAVDAFLLQEKRVAVLLKNIKSKDDEASETEDALLIADRENGTSKFLSPVTTEEHPWTKGRIIGVHYPTGYYFLALWSDEDEKPVFVMAGADGSPPQEVLGH